MSTLDDILKPFLTENRPSLVDVRKLSQICLDDPLERLVWEISPSTVTNAVSERLELLVKSWPALERFWREDLKATPTLETLWRGYLPFANWILRQKRRHFQDRLMVVGIQGSIGQGKSVLSRLLQIVLDRPGDPAAGNAIGISLDDYYLTALERSQPDFASRGYNPAGISNRGPAGTHDLTTLYDDLRKMESGRTVEFPVFDKQRDDRSLERRIILKKIGILILDGWFLGAGAPKDPQVLPEGLKRSVGEALREYQPLFDRLDALWSFTMPSPEAIVANRIQQQKTLDRLTGKQGMTDTQIARFVRYFYTDAWDLGTTSPEPLPERVSFRAQLNHEYGLQHLEKGPRIIKE